MPGSGLKVGYLGGRGSLGSRRVYRGWCLGNKSSEISHCGYNRISGIDPERLQSLIYLDLRDNKISRQVV